MNLIESIYEEPEKWRAHQHHMTHESGAMLWTSNGASFCQPYPSGGYGFFMKLKAWKAFKWWVANAPVESLGIKTP